MTFKSLNTHRWGQWTLWQPFCQQANGDSNFICEKCIWPRACENTDSFWTQTQERSMRQTKVKHTLHLQPVKFIWEEGEAESTMGQQDANLGSQVRMDAWRVQVGRGPWAWVPYLIRHWVNRGRRGVSPSDQGDTCEVLEHSQLLASYIHTWSFCC